MGYTAYFVDYTSSRVFRTRNLLAPAANVVYEDLGQIIAGLNPHWIALDPFNYVNGAMVCGDLGTYLTANLDAALPVWNLSLGGAIPHFRHIQVIPSELRNGAWMISIYGHLPPLFPNRGNVYYTTNGGAAWTNITPGGFASSFPIWIEFSTHDQDEAWAICTAGPGFVQRHTFNLWADQHFDLLDPPMQAPNAGEGPYAGHHCYWQNSNDGLAVRSGSDNLTGSPQVVRWLADHLGYGTRLTLGPPWESDIAGTNQVGRGRFANNLWWLLTGRRYIDGLVNGVAENMLWTSPNGTSWTHRYTFPGRSDHIENLSNHSRGFLATQNGVVAPLLVSLDDGDTWEAKTGNWAGLGYNGDIRCCALYFAPDWGCTISGLPPQAMDCDGDGDMLYLGLEDTATTFPILVRVSLPLDPVASVGVQVFNPGAGNSINVDCTDEGQNLGIAGNFGVNEQVEVTEDGGATWTDIDRDAWGAETAQPLLVDPDTVDEVMVALQTAQDITETDDGGATAWTVNNAAVGYGPAAMARLPDGDELVVGDAHAARKVEYSPNRGVTLVDITGGVALGNIVALEVA